MPDLLSMLRSAKLTAPSLGAREFDNPRSRLMAMIRSLPDVTNTLPGDEDHSPDEDATPEDPSKAKKKKKPAEETKEAQDSQTQAAHSMGFVGSLYGGLLTRRAVQVPIIKKLLKTLQSTPAMTSKQLEQAGGETNLPNMRLYELPLFQNAFYYPKPLLADRRPLVEAIKEYQRSVGVKTSPTTDDEVDAANQHGLIGYDPDKFNTAGILGHEYGHAQIGNKPFMSPSRLNQGPLRMLGGIASGLAPVLSYGLGAVYGPLAGVGAGVGLGLLTNLPMLVNEAQASVLSNKLMDKLRMKETTRAKNRKGLMYALGTYATSTIPSTISGAVGGVMGRFFPTENVLSMFGSNPPKPSTVASNSGTGADTAVKTGAVEPAYYPPIYGNPGALSGAKEPEVQQFNYWTGEDLRYNEPWRYDYLQKKKKLKAAIFEYYRRILPNVAYYGMRESYHNIHGPLDIFFGKERNAQFKAVRDKTKAIVESALKRKGFPYPDEVLTVYDPKSMYANY